MRRNSIGRAAVRQSFFLPAVFDTRQQASPVTAGKLPYSLEKLGSAADAAHYVVGQANHPDKRDTDGGVLPGGSVQTGEQQNAPSSAVETTSPETLSDVGQPFPPVPNGPNFNPAATDFTAAAASTVLPGRLQRLIDHICGKPTGKPLTAYLCGDVAEAAAVDSGDPSKDRGGGYLASRTKDCDNGASPPQDAPESEPGRSVRFASDVFEVVGCGCRSWFCPHCCTSLGLKLRERLVGVLKTFTHVQMWTLTVDPTLFGSGTSEPTPEACREAWEYLRGKRCVARLVRELKRLGHVHSDRWFCVTEWQRNGMPHFHLLLDASHVPFGAVCRVWNHFRPTSAGPVQGGRPGFGAVQFSDNGFKSPQHAANYAAKYLIKAPEAGYCDWVLDYAGEIHRYTSSRGFWGESGKRSAEQEPQPEAETEQTAEHDATCFCDICRGAVDEASEGHNGDGRTIRGRVAECGKWAAVFRVVAVYENGKVRTERDFVTRLKVTFACAARLCGEEAERAVAEGARRFCVSAADVDMLAEELVLEVPQYSRAAVAFGRGWVPPKEDFGEYNGEGREPDQRPQPATLPECRADR